MRRSLLTGNEAVAWGAHLAGCRFFAGYPITPATSIFDAMLKLLPPVGGYVIQGEDEIASMGYCLGASMAGLKAMTATSGPGLSLMSEQICLAVGSEIPLVIVNVQRLGPSTGSATRGADGDIQFLRWGCSGGLPVIVLAPTDAADCFRLTIQAFNLAERFRCPVFLASNKEIGLTRESVDIGLIERPALIERAGPPEGRPFLPFEPDPRTGAPFFLPIGGQTLVRQTSSTHGREGYITTDPGEIGAQIERMARKIESQADQISLHLADQEEGAQVMILTYGVTARAARAACRQLREEGQKVSLLVLQTLWPAPEKLIRRQSEGVERVVVVEMNLGQYVREVERVLEGKRVDFLGRMDGQLISPAAIREAVDG
ncbi:MAG: pyruvate flavodoxin/ferredoxin oxidoreductase [Deltaproteobacteria bacterium]|nr:pyruvate flavodoxin/ferredoxin oxidoreductase [Deltaproteobacteria bacterium]